MDDHYGFSDLRQLISGESTHFRQSTFPQVVPLLFPARRDLAQSGADSRSQYDLMTDMLPELNSECDGATVTTTHVGAAGAGDTSLSTGFEVVEPACDGAATGRWPRQETLILLEIRSRLHHKFREAKQKGPLWDEVSRIMAVEHGYQRSGKKCREKFENLYKYYKKTKKGKNGRQNGGHYRFFRQLDALYGETKTDISLVQAQCLEATTLHSHNNGVLGDQKASQETLSIIMSDCSEFNSISSDENGVCTAKLVDRDISREKRRKREGGRSWREKIKECIDIQMRKMMVKQEVWLEKLMKTLEQKERERRAREEEWRKQEVRRIEREHRIWAKKRECNEARDAALMATLQKLTWTEPENSSPMAGKGGEGDGLPESRKPNDILKKRKQVYNAGGGTYNAEISNRGLEESSRREANPEYSPSISINDAQNGCFEFLMNDGEALWDNHGLKLTPQMEIKTSDQSCV